MLITILGSAKLTNMICDLYNLKSTLLDNFFIFDLMFEYIWKKVNIIF